jgi:hypothetical protein
VTKGRASTRHLWKVGEGFALGENSTAINSIEPPSRAYVVLCCFVHKFVHKEDLPPQSRSIQVAAHKLYGSVFNDYPIPMLEELGPMQLALDPNASRSSKGRSRPRSQQ